MNKAIFLDRDGVINKKAEEHDYIKNLDEFTLLTDVPAAIKLIKNQGYLVIIISNQRGVAKGIMTTEAVNKIHEKLNRLLRQYGVKIDAFYWCGHDYEDRCECRKPSPGLILRSVKDFDIDIRNSWLIGDSEHDKMCAINAGVKYKIIETDGSLMQAVKEIFNDE